MENDDKLRTRNPLGYRCLPNQATPEYVPERDFRNWLAYGLMMCWPSTDDRDPDAGCNYPTVVTVDDVVELRSLFWHAVAGVVKDLRSGKLEPGEGVLDRDFGRLDLGVGMHDEPAGIGFEFDLRTNGLRMVFSCSGSETPGIWLDYEALKDTDAVDKALAESRPVHVPAAPPLEVRKALRSLLDYSWSQEQEDFLEMQGEPDAVEGHVFQRMVEIDNWLCGTNFTPYDYLKEEED